ncbi:hypothetical protein AURDEDRAFT_174574 [Auricularia subglabra TFB-10046 SS5]|uniref:Uncharacterized protein n=1 Tax=Auricularia subglabra (strain TFB-10046 / SS5) TaxID=717982 RepID=J0LG03_AURST|nr:hypothetical protein AURDEDRAFT_174574 [Auricularia subglabra TFB-10046 SS5]
MGVRTERLRRSTSAPSVMPALQVDSYLELRTPVRILPEDIDDQFNTYLSSVTVEGGTLPVSVVHPVRNQYSALAGSGTVAHVVGTFNVVGKGLFVVASSVVGVQTIPSAKPGVHVSHFPPFITFVGKVSREHVSNADRPGLVTIEVTVESKAAWPGHGTVVRCLLNREDRKFRSLRRFLVGVSLEITGTLLNASDGNIEVDVFDIRPGFDGDLPDQPLVVADNLFERLRIVNDFAVFTDPHLHPVYPIYRTAAPSNRNAATGAGRAGDPVASGAGAASGSANANASGSASGSASGGGGAPVRPKAGRAVRGVERGEDVVAMLPVGIARFVGVSIDQIPSKEFQRYISARVPGIMSDLPAISSSLMPRSSYTQVWVRSAVNRLGCAHELIFRVSLLKAMIEAIGGLLMHEITQASYSLIRKRRHTEAVEDWIAKHMGFYDRVSKTARKLL